MSLSRRLALLAWAAEQARLGARGRLRQRVPLRDSPGVVVARHRHERMRHLHRDIQQSDVPRHAARLPGGARTARGGLRLGPALHGFLPPGT
jgi:hypothetical protein